MHSKKSIVYIKPLNSSFINSDQTILEKHYCVDSYTIDRGHNPLHFIWGLVKLFIHLMFCTQKKGVFITWFGDYHATIVVLAGILLRKKTVVIAGGQEAVCYRELGKGVYQTPFRAFCVRYALRNATLILPNHQSLIYHENYFYNQQNPHIDGILHYVKNCKAKIVVVPNGIDTSRIERIQSISKDEKMVLTVANVSLHKDFINKGFDLFIEVARMNPDLKFMLIRINQSLLKLAEEKYKVSEIKNLEIITSFCSDEKLKESFNKAKIFVQVSITEGMPVSLGEAMLCECIPVGSNVNGIPDAIGNNGVIVYQRTKEALNNAIHEALLMNTGKSARDFTIENFSLEGREIKLNEVINSII